jgi:hypothetical protein
MKVYGRECCITLKTRYCELGLPYSEETVREAVSILKEKAPIEGGGGSRALRKVKGVTGCVVTPLTLDTVPLLLALALGYSGEASYVSETHGLYCRSLALVPLETGFWFDVIQARGETRKLYEGCRVQGFELRVMRGEALKLKLDITSDITPVSYVYDNPLTAAFGERFKEDGVKYTINSNTVKNIYGVTIASRREGGARTEVFIHRVLDREADFSNLIENFAITAELFRDAYEERRFGLFRLNLSRLVLMSDETAIDSGGEVIGPLRYYCAGGITAEVFTSAPEQVV